MRHLKIILQALIANVLFLEVALAQVMLSEFHFESLAEISNAGGSTNGTLSLIPGVSGNGISLVNANSVCFPAANILNTDLGTLQFWAKDISANKGLWEVSNVGSNKTWGAFRFFDDSPSVPVDNIHYEMETALGKFARSSSNWRVDPSWHFFVFTWTKGATRTTFTIYVDGIPGTTPALLGNVSLAANSMLCLGQYALKGNSHPAIDEFKSFNYLRSQAQIKADFAALFSGCPIWPYLWNNNLNPADVNRDGLVNTTDALYVLSAIASGTIYNFTTCPDNSLPALALDVSPNNVLNQQDAQAVVNAINVALPPEQQVNINTLTSQSHGDIDANGTLNQDDIAIMVNSFGASVPIFTQGDITGDGVVGSNDLEILRKFTSLEGEWRSVLPLFKIVRP